MNKKLEKIDHKFSIRLIRSSPIGPIVIAAGLSGLTLVSMITEDDLPFFAGRTVNANSAEFVDMAVSQLVEYFSEKRTDFTITTDLTCGTDFQQKVLRETARIPYGQVRTYGEVAAGIGRPRAARAVGGALARNPIGIIIPCHRVVAHDGRLHGFSSPHGIRTKAVLLKHEGLLLEGDRVVKGAV